MAPSFLISASSRMSAWRQPPPTPVGDPALDPATNSWRSRVGGFLSQVFEASEDENKLVILRAVAAGPPRCRVLDLGCFNGAFSSDLGRAARAEQVSGVEWLPEHAEQAEREGIQVRIADLNDPLPYPDGSFDLVHANQVIEHLRDTDAFLREVQRVCAPEGAAIISTNNMAAWHNIGSLALGFQPFPNHVSDEVHVGNPLDPRRGLGHADAGQTHQRIFTTRALTELAAFHGLAVTAVHMNGYYPLPPRLADKAVRIDGRHAAFMVVELAPAGP